MFCPTDVLSLGWFCPSGCFVPPDVLSPDVMSQHVMSQHVLSKHGFYLGEKYVKAEEKKRNNLEQKRIKRKGKKENR
jgi:hypothetical protein